MFEKILFQIGSLLLYKVKGYGLSVRILKLIDPDRVEDDGVQKPLLYFVLGEAHFNLEKYEDSNKYYSMAIAEHGNYPGAYANRAHNHVKLNNPGKAYTDYKFYLDRWGSNGYENEGQVSGAYYNLAGCCLDLEKPEEALEHYAKATESEEFRCNAWSGLGITLRILGRFDEAIDAFQKTLSLDPEHRYANGNLAEIYFQLDRYEEASNIAKHCIELDECDYYSWNILGCCSLEKDEFKKAIYYYKKTLELSPDFVDAYVNLGTSYFENGEHEKGVQQYKWLLAHAPDFTHYLEEFVKPDEDYGLAGRH